jgi:hypothetical protein
MYFVFYVIVTWYTMLNSTNHAFILGGARRMFQNIFFPRQPNPPLKQPLPPALPEITADRNETRYQEDHTRIFFLSQQQLKELQQIGEAYVKAGDKLDEKIDIVQNQLDDFIACTISEISIPSQISSLKATQMETKSELAFLYQDVRTLHKEMTNIQKELNIANRQWAIQNSKIYLDFEFERAVNLSSKINANGSYFGRANKFLISKHKSDTLIRQYCYARNGGKSSIEIGEDDFVLTSSDRNILLANSTNIADKKALFDKGRQVFAAKLSDQIVALTGEKVKVTDGKVMVES